MKLLHMHVDNFGGLHDYSYDFEDGLNVILEDNGWGKTTMAAFLKAMFYGFDSGLSRDIKENERKRYSPWQGGLYGGTLDFEADGVRYRVKRTFGETARFDSVKITNLDTESSVRLSADTLGEELFHLDAGAFQRIAFINQNGMSTDGSAQSIQNRLNSLVSQANNTTAYDSAIGDLSQLIRVYEKDDGRGQLDNISRSLAEKQAQKDLLEREIKEQDIARERVAEISTELKNISSSLEEQKQQYDREVDNRRKLEASRKLLEDLGGEIGVLQDKQDMMRIDFGGTVPSDAQIEEARRNVQKLSDTEERLTQLSGDKTAQEAEYRKIEERYSGRIPRDAVLDDILGVYTELQGIYSAAKQDAEREQNDVIPEGYTAVTKIAAEDSTYPEKLRKAAESQNAAADLLRMKESNCQQLTHEEEIWKGVQNRYEGLTNDISERKKALDEMDAYSPEKIEAPLRRLNELMVRQQDLEREQASLEKVLEKESEDWKALKVRYSGLKEESAARKKELEDADLYRPEKITPYLARIGELQRLDQAVAIKQEAVNRNRITAEEKGILEANKGDLPAPGEADRMKEIYRRILQGKQAEQSYTAKLSTEQTKAEELNTTLLNLEAVKEDDGLEPKSEPEKHNGTPLLVLGLLLLIGGAAAAVLVMPALGAIALLGLVLIILGISGNGKYKKALAEYQAYQEELNRRTREKEQKKTELRSKIEEVENGIRSLNSDLETGTARMKTDEKEVIAWVKKYGRNEKLITEEVISRIGINADRLRNLRAKAKDIGETQQFIDEENMYIAQVLTKISTVYPEISGMKVSQASDCLHEKETEYRLKAERYNDALKAEEKFLEETGCTKEQFDGTIPLEPSEVKQKLEALKNDFAAVDAAREETEQPYEGLSGMGFEDAIAELRKRAENYKVAEGQLQTARQSEVRYLLEAGVTRETVARPDSDKTQALRRMKAEIGEKYDEFIQSVKEVLAPVHIEVDEEHVNDALRSAGTVYREYEQYTHTLNERAERDQKRSERISALESELAVKSSAMNHNYENEELPKQVELVKNDIRESEHLKEKITSLARSIAQASEERSTLEAALITFRITFGRFAPEGSDVIAAVAEKAAEFRKVRNEMAPLLRQRDAVLEEQKAMPDDGGKEENRLRRSIAMLEQRRESLLEESSQKKEFIRQTDRSVERCPDVTREIRQLYEQKESAANELSLLKRTISMISRAKDNLADRYLSKVERLFNDYMHVWLGSDAVRGILDIDFNVSIEENQRIHVAEGYSTGYCDLIDFCMRLALIDTLFEHEQPFMILDDPFVNLDEEHLTRALELLSAMSASRQIVYFVCHPVRAVKTGVSDRDKEAFRKLAENARKTLEQRMEELPDHAPKPPVSLLDRYTIEAPQESLPFVLENPDFVIRETVFPMAFRIKGGGIHPDRLYELFFIDGYGHVVSDHRLMELRNERLCPSELQFSLNAGPKNGTKFALMVRESGSDDFDITAAIPFDGELKAA